MRGKGKNRQSKFPHTGITPAYAGKSFLSTSRAFCNQDHPRLCGEKGCVFVSSGGLLGSPPPMRGKVFFMIKFLHVFRITPAYAGKSDSGGDMYPQRRDHPRLCGEKRKIRHGKEVGRGSPPPMRGKVLDGYKDNPYYRITPAYAGKRSNSSPSNGNSWDHPRLCGEKVHT